MATWHKAADPLLNMNIPALAHTISKSVIECQPGDDLQSRMRDACASTERADAVSGSRITTLIVPHDSAWQKSPAPVSPAGPKPLSPSNGSSHKGSYKVVEPLPEGAKQFLRDCGAALKGCAKGKAAIYIGGKAGIMDGTILILPTKNQ